uniref:Fibronectin type-III domain-containing protein n=1 Tax=Macrostomum lignano TaxID=282301 RepID=A0A1I8FC72_9PLAT
NRTAGDTWLRLRLAAVNSAGLAASEAALLTLRTREARPGPVGRIRSVGRGRCRSLELAWTGQTGQDQRPVAGLLAGLERDPRPPPAPAGPAAANRGSPGRAGHSVRPESGAPPTGSNLTARTLAGDGPLPGWTFADSRRPRCCLQGLRLFSVARPAKRRSKCHTKF